MASTCPNCGAKLKWYDFRAECKKCGANIPNYNWEKRLEDDADQAETAFAKLHYRLSNFKSGTVGNPFRIIRLIFTLLPLVALVVPLVKLDFNFPFYGKTGQTVSFLTLILNYITKLDFFGGFSLMSGEALGHNVTLLMCAILLALLAVVAGVLNFVVVLIAALNLKAGFNVVLNVIATACWTASAITLSMFASSASSSSINVVQGTVIWWDYAIGIALFAINIVINIITQKSFKKQLKNQPSLEESIEKELREIREEELQPITE